MGPDEIRQYLVYLTNEKHLAPSSIIITVAALRFLYTVTLPQPWSVEAVIPTPKQPQTVPIVLSPPEVVQFLDRVTLPKDRAILTTCYGAGRRISEAVHLTIPAIDSQRMVLRVEQGKGQKDQYVMLSPKLLEILREWWRVSRPRHWLFPGAHPDDPITTDAVSRACRMVHRRFGDAETDHAPFIAPLCRVPDYAEYGDTAPCVPANDRRGFGIGWLLLLAREGRKESTMKYIVNGDIVLSRPPEGPLAAQIGAFAKWASEQGYARYSRYRQVLLAACFSRWLGRQVVSVGRVSSEQPSRYLRSRARRVRLHKGDAAALRQFIDCVHSGGVIPAEKIARPRLTPIEQAAQTFGQYLLNDRALVRATVLNYVPFIRGFLTDRFGSGSVRLSRLRARDVMRCVQRQAPRLHLKRAKLLTTAL